MEIHDAFTVFIFGIAVGVSIYHYVIARAERRHAFEEGRHAGLAQLWPHLVTAWAAHLAATRQAAEPGADGG